MKILAPNQTTRIVRIVFSALVAGVVTSFITACFAGQNTFDLLDNYFGKIIDSITPAYYIYNYQFNRFIESIKLSLIYLKLPYNESNQGAIFRDPHPRSHSVSTSSKPRKLLQHNCCSRNDTKFDIIARIGDWSTKFFYHEANSSHPKRITRISASI